MKNCNFKQFLQFNFKIDSVKQPRECNSLFLKQLLYIIQEKDHLELLNKNSHVVFCTLKFWINIYELKMYEAQIENRER